MVTLRRETECNTRLPIVVLAWQHSDVQVSAAVFLIRNEDADDFRWTILGETRMAKAT